MTVFTTFLSFVIGWAGATSGYLIARSPWQRYSDEPPTESTRTENALYAVLVAAAAGQLALAITNTAMPGFPAMMFAAAGMVAGLTGVIIGAVRRRHVPRPRTNGRP